MSNIRGKGWVKGEEDEEREGEEDGCRRRGGQRWACVRVCIRRLHTSSSDKFVLSISAIQEHEVIYTRLVPPTSTASPSNVILHVCILI